MAKKNWWIVEIIIISACITAFSSGENIKEESLTQASNDFINNILGDHRREARTSKLKNELRRVMFGNLGY